MQSESNDKKEREIKILFLDDHPGLREGIADLLKNKNPNLTFFMASSAEEAASTLNAHKDISLLILDLNLDGLNKRTLVYQKMELSDRLSLIETARTLGIVE